MKTTGNNIEGLGVFKGRLDFYWRSISAYAIVLLVYILLRGAVENGVLMLSLTDPIILLLGLFIVATSLSLLFQWSKGRSITLGKDFIILKSRLGEKTYVFNDIVKISLGRERNVKPEFARRLILIRLKSRKRALKIRLSSYGNDQKLAELMNEFRKNFDAYKKRTS